MASNRSQKMLDIVRAKSRKHLITSLQLEHGTSTSRGEFLFIYVVNRILRKK